MHGRGLPAAFRKTRGAGQRIRAAAFFAAESDSTAGSFSWALDGTQKPSALLQSTVTSVMFSYDYGRSSHRLSP